MVVAVLFYIVIMSSDAIHLGLGPTSAVACCQVNNGMLTLPTDILPRHDLLTRGPTSRVVVSVSRSRSRDVPTSCLGFASEKIVKVSVSSRSRPFTSRAQDQFSAKLCRPH